MAIPETTTTVAVALTIALAARRTVGGSCMSLSRRRSTRPRLAILRADGGLLRDLAAAGQPHTNP